jgi:molecular chaperone GrpE
MEHQTGCTMDNDAEHSTEQHGMQDNGAGEIPLPNQLFTAEPDEQKKAYDELNDRFLRLAADFENFKKRTARDREMAISFANERFAIDILEVVDNLERALKADDTHLREGICQIQQLLNAQMLRNGINPVDALKKPFNPSEHEAIAHVTSDEKAGTVIDVVARGYRMHDKVIRYAKVAVSKGNQNNQEV